MYSIVCVLTVQFSIDQNLQDIVHPFVGVVVLVPISAVSVHPGQVARRQN